MSVQEMAERPQPRPAASSRTVAASLRGMRVVDLSPTLQRGIPNWPMHPPLVIDKAREVERDGYYLSAADDLGTHRDACRFPGAFPSLAHAHVDRHVPGRQADRAPPCCMIFPTGSLGRATSMTLDMVAAYERAKGVQVGAGEIALINFGWMQRYWRTDARSAPGS